MSDLLSVWLNEVLVGKLFLAPGEQIVFTFDPTYLEDSNRPMLSQSFLNRTGDVISTVRATHTQLPSFFSNLLPEGQLRQYLADKGGVNPAREFKLIELLGKDLPGAVLIKPMDGLHTLPNTIDSGQEQPKDAYRFSLAGIQLKFSALGEKNGGLTIPASGVGGDWIIKLPALNYPHVPENEWSMMQLAKKVGIEVPEIKLVNISDIAGLPDLGVLSGKKALAVKRFDRGPAGERIHIEDFAQVYGLYPINKYSKVSYNNMANLIWRLMGEAGLKDFIKRLIVTVMIGNGDMHLKNWSLIYRDGKKAELAPAYDYVSTIPYLPQDKLALTLSDTKDMRLVTSEYFKKLAKKAQLPELVVMQAVEETVSLLRAAWESNKSHYPLTKEITERIDEHISHFS